MKTGLLSLHKKEPLGRKKVFVKTNKEDYALCALEDSANRRRKTVRLERTYDIKTL